MTTKCDQCERLKERLADTQANLTAALVRAKEAERKVAMDRDEVREELLRTGRLSK